MTREKAVNEYVIPALKNTWNEKVCTEVINALEQEPCEDCISRQSAIFLANDLKEDLPDDEHIANMVLAHNEGILEYQTKLSLLPPVTPQPKTGHWIPVSERLPERPYGCLVTVMDTNPMTFDEFENIYPDFVGWDGENWNDADGYSIPFEVIAWMPLPKPYKAESEEP